MDSSNESMSVSFNIKYIYCFATPYLNGIDIIERVFYI